MPEMPILKERPAISQAERVRDHLRTDNVYGCLLIASQWPRLGDIREAVTKAWEAYQRPEGFQDAPAVIQEGLQALRERLGVD